MNDDMQALGADAVGDWKEVLRWTRQKAVVVANAKNNLDDDAIHTLKVHQVLIRVAWADLNPVDLQKLKQQRPAGAATFITGFGGSGVVLHVGAGVEAALMGARVAFLAGSGGAFAEYVVVDARAVAVIPDGTSLADAAILPLAGCTAYESLVKLGLGPNQTTNTTAINPTSLTAKKRRLLIVGGAGGVGSWATLLAKAWHPDTSMLEVICTASSPASTTWCLQQGADRVIAHDEILSLPGAGLQGSMNAILCLTEPIPTLFKAMSEVLRPYGSLCLVVPGPSIQTLDAGFLFFKSANIFTEALFSSFRTNFEHDFLPSSEMADIMALLVSGRVKMPPHATISCNRQDWKQALDEGGVLQTLSSGHTQGKLCMRITSELE